MTGEPDARALLRRWRDGDQAALEELIRHNLQWISRYVHGRLGAGARRLDETMDLVQEAMADVLRYGPRVELADGDQFRRLLARIVENNIRDRRRFLRRDCRDGQRDERMPTDGAMTLDPSMRSPTDPPVRAETNERREWVRLALELLDASDREVLHLREWLGLTFEEIGSRLEITTNAARMRFDRAVPKLARKVAALRAGGLSGELE